MSDDNSGENFRAPRMKIFAFYKKIDDWRRKTSRLSLQQRGVYGELIDWYYCTGGSLPDDLDELCRMVGAIRKSERKDVEKVVNNSTLFSKRDGRLVQNACEENLFSMSQKSSKARAAARARWNDNNGLGDADALPMFSDRNATHNPLPINHKSNPNTVPSSARGAWGLKNNMGGRIVLLEITIQRAKEIIPGADIHSLENEWNKTRREMPRDPDAAFLGWVRVYAKNHPELGKRH